MSNRAIEILNKLISCHSITPNDAGTIEYITTLLQKIGFDCQIENFDGTTNLYAFLNQNQKENLMFLGHVDVVPPGEHWHSDPFQLTASNNLLYGRGVSDMKGAIACFISAIEEIVTTNKIAKYNLSLLLTSDEEGTGLNGTKKMLEHIEGKIPKINLCIVGEPTAFKTSGDAIKIGRRGSVNISITIHGKQGHTAYPHQIVNPITQGATLLEKLNNITFDQGNEHFAPSHLTITSVTTNSLSANVTPSKMNIKCNIRFNNLHSSQEILQIIQLMCHNQIKDTQYTIEHETSGESFLNPEGTLLDKAKKVIQTLYNIVPSINTDGGTSDARFIHKYCTNTIELGLPNNTIHQANECITTEDLDKLENIYKNILMDQSTDSD